MVTLEWQILRQMCRCNTGQVPLRRARTQRPAGTAAMGDQLGQVEPDMLDVGRVGLEAEAAAEAFPGTLVGAIGRRSIDRLGRGVGVIRLLAEKLDRGDRQVLVRRADRRFQCRRRIIRIMR
jgi:hypothetical protein